MSDEVNFENVDALPDVENNAEAAAVTEEPQEAPVEATVETENDGQEEPADSSEDAAGESDEPVDAGQAAVDEFSKSLRTLEGKWYVLHTYSGYEKRVKTNVESRVQSFGLEAKIFQIEVPMEEVEKHTEKGKPVVSSAKPKASPALSARPRIRLLFPVRKSSP